MRNIFFISDLHFNHKSIVGWRLPGKFTDVEEHNLWLVEQINSVIRNNRSILWILGDIAWNAEGLKYLDMLNGTKKFILGNHDKMNTSVYAGYGTVRPGLFGYKGFWLSHCPIHPQELRGRRNIHGHVHSHSIDDDRYINVCVENCNGVPVNIEELT